MTTVTGAEIFRIYPDSEPLQHALMHAALMHQFLLMHRSGAIVASPRPLPGFRLCRGVSAMRSGSKVRP